jgi:phage baseplate assembly protein gpV
MNEALLQDLLDHVKGRFYGKYRGVVTDVDAATMRIKASVPAVLPGLSTGWCMPCVPYAGPQVGFLMLPDIGSGVWIEFEGGDVSYPIWTGCYWSSGDVPSSASATVKTVITSAGTLSFDTGGGTVTLEDSSQNSLVFDGMSAAVTAGSGKIEVGASGVSVNNGALEVS